MVAEGQVRRFLDGSGSPARWRVNKYGVLAGFYRYAISRGYASRSPMPAADEEPRSPQSAPSYIYSREELRQLFEAVDINRKHAIRLDADTLRTLLLTLYGAGPRSSEALHLTMEDVDLATAVLRYRVQNPTGFVSFLLLHNLQTPCECTPIDARSAL